METGERLKGNEPGINTHTLYSALCSVHNNRTHGFEKLVGTLVTIDMVGIICPSVGIGLRWLTKLGGD